MNRISILDCTLRDGGYINDFRFGKDCITGIISKLVRASIDIIECGFMKSGEDDCDCTLFGSIEAFRRVIGAKNSNTLYVGMIQYGAISPEEISEYDGTSVDGIRITFHEHEINGAFQDAWALMNKGYKVFMQPVGTTTYTERRLLELIEKINELKPFAFYIVDTLGTLYKNDLLRMFYLVDHNLDKQIVLGFHSHNNLQMSFANAQELVQINTPRKIILDSTVYGMGRGAGNLNTELIAQYINANFGLTYTNGEILSIIDDYIKPFQKQYSWGYDVPYYLASISGCHPNYASFLMNMQTLRIQDIYAILGNLDKERAKLYDKDYIYEVYLNFMNHHVDDGQAVQNISKSIAGRKIILLAPGRALRSMKKAIKKLQNSKKFYTISVNFVPKDIHCDMVFVSNMKRFDTVEKLLSSYKISVVVTSNIMTEQMLGVSIVDYRSYNNEELSIIDNAGLMCINLLVKAGVTDIKLAGFDGFGQNMDQNFCEPSLSVDMEWERIMTMNMATKRKLKQLKRQINIEFISESYYDKKE